MKYKIRESNPMASQGVIDIATQKLENRVKNATKHLYNKAITPMLIAEAKFILERELDAICEEYCLCRPNVESSVTVTGNEMTIKYKEV